MSENQSNLEPKSSMFSFSKYTWIILSIIGISFSIRFYFFPYDIPLTADSLYYFWYSSDIYQIGELPKTWTPANNGWAIFVSMFFRVFDTENIFDFMEIQKILSTIIATMITIPTYYVCKKFVSRKIAIVGATFIAFDPRLIINSLLGVTDPLYLLLITSSLALFLSTNKKLIYLSFLLVSLSVLVRVEGIAFFVVLSIMFFVRFKSQGFKILPRYIPIIAIFFIIILPMTNYQNEVNGSDLIFTRIMNSAETTIGINIENDSIREGNNFVDGIEVFTKFLIWVLIPNFIIFIPFGIFLIFKNRNFEKNTIILSLGIMAIPAFYAYTIPALDTRYLYTLLPMFVVLSVLVIEKISNKIQKQKLFVILIISTILISSVLFYDYKKIDYTHEMESFEVMKQIAPNVKGVNNLSTESRYLQSIQTINQWPNLYSNMKFDIKIISDKDSTSLDEFIMNSKERGLSHIMIDDNQDRHEYLKELFFEESKYTYLKKIFDSRDHGFDYQIKVFEINYDILESSKGN